MAKPELDLIFEVSWEVCNKVGGIYTVLSSKSHVLNSAYNDNLVFIGPDLGDQCAAKYFVADKTPDPSLATGKLPYNIKVRSGRWNIPGRPRALLVSFKGLMSNLNSFYGETWERYGVDSLHAYGDYDEACAFSIAAAIVIGSVYERHKKQLHKVVAHFNEWTTGMGLLYVKTHYPAIATVFTTHATSIGRSICGNGKALYGYLPGYNGDQMAFELNMQSKHSLEKQAAHNADCFTAVSEITADECAQLLELRPQVVTPNGFEREIAGTQAARDKKRKTARDKIFKVAEALTGCKYSPDTMIVATSGRNEYRNKGIDVFLDTLADLRQKNLARPILALVLVPAWVKEPRTDLTARLSGDKSIYPTERYITHWLNNPWEDKILERIKALGFNNSETDRVHVVYVPCYLDGNDGIINLDYYDMLPALDITVFPSYYEPWGYTPLESIAFGVPTITTSLSGFGRWVRGTFTGKYFEQTGVGVVERGDFNYFDVVQSIAAILQRFAQADNKRVEAIRKAALATASVAEWENFIDRYYDAFALALKNRAARNKSDKQIVNNNK